uniref:Uncharacterized protein n=1 Tax=Brugia malayi TaxID=6279 RepID=A8QGB7_BRUMA
MNTVQLYREQWSTGTVRLCEEEYGMGTVKGINGTIAFIMKIRKNMVTTITVLFLKQFHPLSSIVEQCA